jgi:DNA-binding NarL/FixJ family response regulator
MKVLILEDAEERIAQFKKNMGDGNLLVFTDRPKEAIDLLKEGKWDVLFLDHDLSGKFFVPSGKDTGYEVATFLEANEEFKPGTIVVHSMNPVGANNIMAALKTAKRIPEAWTKTLQEVLKF